MDMSKLDEVLERLRLDAARAAGEFETANEKYVDTLKTRAARILALAEEYKDVLKKPCDSEAHGGMTAANVDANPYVVAIFDVNSIFFKESILRKNKAGGTKAAQLIEAAIKKHVGTLPDVPRNSRIKVTMYGDLLSFSDAAVRAKLLDASLQPRGLAPFAASFTASSPFFDFIDTGDKHITKIKTSENFNLYATDPSCKHIFFGIGLAPIYLDMLKTYEGSGSRLSLVCAGSIDRSYERLDMGIIEFNEVFRATHRSKAASASPATSTALDGHEAPQQPAEETILANEDLYEDPKDSDNHQDEIHPEHRATPQTPAFDDNPWKLPTSEKPGLIPVNAHDERIDMYMRLPTQAEQAAYMAQVRYKTPCYYSHLQGQCTVSSCQFDHGCLNDAATYVLKYLIQSKRQCNMKGKCRHAACFWGHHCQRSGCVGGKSSKCQYNVASHASAKVVARWVLAEGKDGGRDAAASAQLPGSFEGRSVRSLSPDAIAHEGGFPVSDASAETGQMLSGRLIDVD